MIYIVSELAVPMNEVEAGLGDAFLVAIQIVLAIVWVSETLPNFLSYFYLDGVAKNFKRQALSSKSSIDPLFAY